MTKAELNTSSRPSKRRVRAVGYARSETGGTIGQTAWIEEYARENDMELVAIHRDDFTGSGALTKPGFQAMLADLGGSRSSVLIVCSVDRLARDTRQLEGWLRFIAERGVTVHETST